MFMFMRRFSSQGGARATAALLYGANTYIISVGNQHMFIGLVYGIAPFVIGGYLDAFESVSCPRNARRYFSRMTPAIGPGLLLSLALMLDARIALLILAASVFLGIISIIVNRKWKPIACAFGFSLAIVAGTHAYWIVPLLLHGHGAAYAGILPPVPWISWADLPHAIALNEPFWTGAEQTYFHPNAPSMVLQLTPVFAFGALLIRRRYRDWRLGAFGFLSLIGVFLVKGENPPFGEAYRWLFLHLPPMRLFRDMSKFNLFVALGYAVLIGSFVASLIEGRVRDRNGVSFIGANRTFLGWLNQLVRPALVCVVIAVVLFGARPLLTQDMGIMRTRAVPSAYAEVARVLGRDPEFGRVLWVPGEPRFSSRSRRHPAVVPADFVDLIPESSRFVDTPTELLFQRSINEYLYAYAVRYIVVDLREELAGYPGANNEQRSFYGASVEESLDSLSSTTLLSRSGGVTVFGVRGTPAFATVSLPDVRGGPDVTFSRSFDGARRVEWRPSRNGAQSLIISERFHKGWHGEFVGQTANGREIPVRARHVVGTRDRNSWEVDVPSGVVTVKGQMRLRAQRYANAGVAISSVTLLALLGAIFARPRKRTRS
ncbi:MAG TPA: hypothetical protein VM142_01835 [Acidimicrobiales bacterium]|nr:hypothetical protein [Acidimicrobiales bacterium]